MQLTYVQKDSKLIYNFNSFMEMNDFILELNPSFTITTFNGIKDYIDQRDPMDTFAEPDDVYMFNLVKYKVDGHYKETFIFSDTTEELEIVGKRDAEFVKFNMIKDYLKKLDILVSYCEAA